MEKSIPYFKIKQGSTIALYGCGDNGVVCYNQLIKNGYCNLAVLVDKNYADKVVDGKEVQPISKLQGAEYDYVLITICDEDISLQVKSALTAMGLPEDKILSMDDRTALLRIENIQDADYMQMYLEKGFEKMYGLAKKPGEYYSELESTMLAYKNDEGYILNYLKAVLPKIKNDEKKLILMLLMYTCECIDRECMKLFMKQLENCEWKDDTYYGLAIDTTVMVFKQPQCIYNEFFQDRRMLHKKICEHYELYEIPNISKSKEQKKKIAIVAAWYSPDCVKEAVSRITRNYAIEFADMGYEVKIFVLCTITESDLSKKFLMKYNSSPNDALYIKTDDELLKKHNVQIEAQYGTDLRKRLQSSVRSIIDYQPSFILDMADEVFPEAYALIRYFTIINFPMRGNAYSSEADMYIFADLERVKRDNEKYHSMPIERVREVLLGNLSDWNSSGSPYVREEHGFGQEDFIMVTVGARLRLEIDDEMINYVCKLLTEQSIAKWLLVGDKVKSDNALFSQFIGEKRIINWGYEEHLDRLYPMCDIYLNPQRGGGGVSIRLAMRYGLPVAMTDFPSDVRSRMEQKHIVHGGYKELMEYVGRLCSDQELYRRVSEETRKRAETFSPRNDAEKVLKVCWEAVELFGKEDLNL